MMAEKPVCKIDGCEKPKFSRGWCRAHYARWYRHGNPTDGKRRSPNGEPERYLRDVVLPYAGEECLFWPFTRTGRKDSWGGHGRGYAQMRQGRKMVSVPRIVCEHVNGEAPDKDCGHTCGNGHLGCVNPAHMTWLTRRELIGMAIERGTHSFCR